MHGKQNIKNPQRVYFRCSLYDQQKPL